MYEVGTKVNYKGYAAEVVRVVNEYLIHIRIIRTGKIVAVAPAAVGPLAAHCV